jgi:tetratricopeptide (TPR) repeat protein
MKKNAKGGAAVPSKSIVAQIEKHQKPAIAILIALVIVVGGYFAYTYLYQAPREEKAQAALFKGETYFGIGAFNEALNGDNRGYVGFLRIIKEYSGTPTANLAKGYAGISYAQLGNYKAALEYLDDFSANDAIIAPAVIGAQGDCYVELKQYDKALSAYLKAVDKADSKAVGGNEVNHTISPLFLMKAGLVYENQKNYAEALKVYQRVKDVYLNSYQTQSGEIEKYIERAKALS